MLFLALAIFTDISETSVFPLSINHAYLFGFRVRGVFTSMEMS